MEDFYSDVKLIRALSPVVATDDTALVSEIIDLQGYNKCLLGLLLGTLSDANTTIVALLEEGDAANLSDAAAVADADMVGTEAEMGFQYNDDNEPRKLCYVGSKRYIRLTLTPTGNTGNIPVSVLAILSAARKSPLSQ